MLFASLAYLYKAWPGLSERWFKHWERRVYGIALGLMLLAVTFTGHLGGVLTHGPDYLTRYLPDGLRQVAGLQRKADIGRLQLENPSETTVYSALIAPILDTRCVACHNSSVQRGGLRLDAPEFITEGGNSGPVVVAGRAHESELIHRIWLPPISDDRYASKRKVLSSRLRKLNSCGGGLMRGHRSRSFLPDAEWSQATQTIVDYMGLGEIRTGIFALETAPPDSMDIVALAGFGVSVTPLAEEEPYLQVRCANLEVCTDADRLQGGLRRLGPNIAWLDLGRSQVGDDLVEVICRYATSNTFTFATDFRDGSRFSPPERSGVSGVSQSLWKQRFLIPDWFTLNICQHSNLSIFGRPGLRMKGLPVCDLLFPSSILIRV